MKDECHRIEELAEIADLAPGSPGRRHLDTCPRCQARLLTYDEFMRSDGECNATLLARAVDHLGASLDREIHGAQAGGEAKARQRAIIYPLRSPFVRGALAVAASLVVFFGLSRLWDQIEPNAPRTTEIVLRSEERGVPAKTVILDEPRFLDTGGIILSWQPLPGADGYRVKIMDAELNELAEIPAGPDPSLQLAPARLSELLPGPGAYAWVVIASSEGDEIARSQPSSLRVGQDR